MKKAPRFHSFLVPTMLFTLVAHAGHQPISIDSEHLNRLLNQSEAETAEFLKFKNAKGQQFIFPHTSNADEPLELWSMLDSIADHIEGTSTEKTYLDPRFPKAGKEIIVAVIDSGVDIKHEDLQGKIWVNAKEIPGNGIDDDKNGYIDDVNGWNFLGNKKGENIGANTLEVTREYARLKKKKESTPLTAAEATYFAELKKIYEKGLRAAQIEVKDLQAYLDAIALLMANGLKEETMAALEAMTAHSPEIDHARTLVARIYSGGYDSRHVKAAKKEADDKVNITYNITFDSSSIVGDNPAKMDEVGYGNNDVQGPDALHGTHVAGIIAANRNNGIGMLGQADSVKIMSVRAVPDGDERDKDVANAILYAVKNGASVINMSFGKPYSPNKAYVDQAIAFAEKSGVLLIHAAGNESKNTESAANNFPNSRLFKGKSNAHSAANWIEVGASTSTKDEHLVAGFSNWGKTSVDLFAPGVRIYSTTPRNRYQYLQGTSMASPEVAGVAALLLAHFPNKSSKDVLKAMMTTTTQYPSLKVIKPLDYYTPEDEMIPFSQLSKSGGIVNTFTAMEALLK